MVLIPLAVAMAGSTIQVPVVSLKPGLVIDRSCRIEAGTYRLASRKEDGSDAAIRIAGSNITVDFAGAVLEGSDPAAAPDKREGTGILVSGQNVTLRNATVKGYKVGLMAKGVPGLKILDSDFSYNWKQRLLSTPEREDGADWMSYHQNEKDEWLRYGAGIYLRGCDRFEVRNTRIIGGQNGLMITECDEGLAWNNNFSFLSSLGIGMYRSSENRVMHNNIDWCVRGFSFGRYNRGQDSAGILIYEQSNKNVFAYNSVTHGGDGFFLWAGQTTMDTGKGGCNDNLLYGNDFSHAPTNGIEATFSRNTFANNLVMECWHGIWGGYSWESRVVGNIFAYNAEGIAWEHGQDNLVDRNAFYRNHEDLVVWANATQDPNWGYPKNRNTKSTRWIVTSNVFSNTFANVFRMHRTNGIRIENNHILYPGRVFRQGDASPGAEVAGLEFRKNRGTVGAAEPILEGNDFKVDPVWKPLPSASSLNQGPRTSREEYLARFSSIAWNPYGGKEAPSGQPLELDTIRKAAGDSFAVPPLRGGKVPFLKPGTLRGWRYMIVDEWGPYDFKRPILWPREETDDGQIVFEILGPPGEALLAENRGLTVTGTSLNGTNWTAPMDQGAKVPVPSFVRAKPALTRTADLRLMFEYVGEATVDHRGIATPKGKPVRFGWSKFETPIDWEIRWYCWNQADVADPKSKMPEPGKLLSRQQIGEPVAEIRTTKLDFATGGSPRQGVPDNYFLTLASGAFEVDAGEYEIGVTSDDGVRVWLDDKLVIDQWHWQGPTRYSHTAKLGGRHRLRVEHYEIDGYTALKVELAPKR